MLCSCCMISASVGNAWLLSSWPTKFDSVQCESKIPPPSGLRFSDIFPQTVENFKSISTHLLHVPIYVRLQIFIQLSPTLTKLCHIKRDYLVHVICSKWSSSVETHAFRRLRKSSIALLIVVCGKASHPRSDAAIMSTNMLDMTSCQQWRHLLSKKVTC